MKIKKRIDTHNVCEPRIFLNLLSTPSWKRVLQKFNDLNEVLGKNNLFHTAIIMHMI